MKDICLTRKELYDRIWAKPIRDNAKELGLSDVGLGKLCRRAGIPLPPKGYWLMAPGPDRDCLIEPLPPPVASERTSFRFRLEDAGLIGRANAARQRAEQSVAKAAPSPANLAEVRRLVKAMRDAIDVRKRDERGILVPGGKLPVPLRVSPAQLDRALLALERLAARLLALEAPIEQHGEHGGLLTVGINGQKYSFWIEETSKRSERPLTAKEQKERERDPKCFYYRDRWQYTPAGTLAMKLSHDRYHWPRRQWGDTIGAGVEDRADVIVADAFAQAEVENAEEERQGRAQRSEKAQQLWAFREIRRERFAALKVRELKRQARDWTRAQMLRGYVDAVAQAELPALPSFRSAAERDDWLAWTRRIIAALDPIESGRAGASPKRQKWFAG
jgi:hypothetical protein